MPLRRCAAATPGQPQTPFDEFVDLDQAVRRKPARDQFDRQRHAVKLAADSHHRFSVDIGDRTGVTSGGRAFHEQAQGRIFADGGDIPQIFRRNLERGKLDHKLARRIQRFPTCRQNADRRRVTINLLGQSRDGFYDMLAIVEDQEKLSITQSFDQPKCRVSGGDYKPERRGQSNRNEMSVLEAGEIKKFDPVPVVACQPMGESDGDRCLADSSGPTKSDKLPGLQMSGEVIDDSIAPDETVRRGRKILSHLTGRRVARLRLRWSGGIARDRGHETIAATGDVGDVGFAVLAIAQDAAQLRDVEAQTAFIDRNAGPCHGHPDRLC